MSRIEFGITPMRGYRKWDVRGGRLVSHYNQVWPLRAPAQAACTHCSRAGLPIPSGTRHGHFAGEGCGLYAWSAPELVERQYTLLSKRIQCWGVVEGWGRVVEHEKGFRALCMRPLALSPMFSIDLKLLKDMTAAYEIPLLMSVGEVCRAFLPAAHHRCPVMTPHLPGGFQLAHMAGDIGTVIGVLQFLSGDGFGVYEHVRLYVGGDRFVEAQPGGASCRVTPPPGQARRSGSTCGAAARGSSACSAPRRRRRGVRCQPDRQGLLLRLGAVLDLAGLQPGLMCGAAGGPMGIAALPPPQRRAGADDQVLPPRGTAAARRAD